MKQFFNGRFRGGFADPRLMPSWAKYNYSPTTTMTAKEAWEDMGPYDVQKRKVYVQTATGKALSDYQMLRRCKTPDDPQERDYGIVGSKYQLISPSDMVEMASQYIKDFTGKALPISTMGVFGTGETMFIAWALPDYAVAGDEMKAYLMLKAPYMPNRAIVVGNTDQRIICWNTLLAAERTAVEKLSIEHHRNPRERLQKWLADIYKKALDRSGVIKEAYEVMAAARLNPVQVNMVLAKVIPAPAMPTQTDHPEHERRMATWESAMNKAQAARDDIRFLFYGAGTGAHTPAVAGTGFGLFNAVSEWADWRKTSDTRAAGNDLISNNGARATTIRNTYSAVMEAIR
jgi:hypothetical protein